VSEPLPPFQRFLDTHRGEVWRLIRASVPAAEADDCFQETFIAALRAYPRLRSDSDLRAWVLTIAHRKTLDAHRARARRALPVADPAGAPRRAAVGCGRRAADAPALGRGAALPGGPPPPRHRDGDRLLGGGCAAIAARGPSEAQRGGTGMRDELQRAPKWIEQALRSGPQAGTRGRAASGARERARANEAEAQRAAARVEQRIAAEGLADVSYTIAESPFGELLLAATKRGLVKVAFPEEDVEVVLARIAAKISPRIVHARAPLEDARRELDEYFAGRRRDFELPLDWALTGEFARRVLRYTARIPYGGTSSYHEAAAAAGSPRGSRAAGNALGSNPIPIIVPCHRVLRSGGALGGYGGGLERKRWLLGLEGALAHAR
jgi:methylated-DNA-[protein]-cysteine S-methyltransferase